MNFHCCDELRRNATAAHPALNGLDWLEVLDGDLPETHPFRQRTLLVHFIKPIAGLTRENLRLSGGERMASVRVEWAVRGEPVPAALSAEEAALLAARPPAERTCILVVRTDSTGDHSPYRLRLVSSPSDDRVPDGFDPQLAEIAFSFKVECPSDFDCRALGDCPPGQVPAPEINYLAKDYASLRRLLLDRVRHLVPDWTGRSAADPGVTLVELLAYVGDQLSYQQDAVATEAYLGTARERVSLRRHAVLVDYAMHDGCNARVWLELQIGPATLTLPKAGTQFLTRCEGAPPVLAPGSTALTEALAQRPLVFEPLHEATLRAAHNRISFYTWGDRRCCLPKGATRATLKGHHPELHPGSYLLFEELLGPQTGAPGDADPAHRHVVQLTQAIHEKNGGTALTDPLTGEPFTEIAWADEDALPFALCVSTVTDEAHGSVYLAEVSVARGNLILADHGATRPEEDLGTVPPPRLFRAPAGPGDRCEPPAPLPVPPRYRPRLMHGPLTHAGGFDAAAPAARALCWAMADVQPQLRLVGTFEGEDSAWLPRRTLLGSAADALEFVAEVGDDGIARLRFGDDRLGRRPDSGTAFRAIYRAGNGTSGNVGPESIVHVVSAPLGIDAVRNPLAAAGGVDAESAESVRRRAPEAFRRRDRAVTEEDYAEVTERYPGIANAAATLRWTGSWHTVFITVDRAGGGTLTPQLRTDLERQVDRYRMAGHDLELNEPIYVPLELALLVCVKRDWFRDDVRRALEERLSNRVLRDGRRGLFHPDNFSFGQPVYLSRIYAAARAVPGVDSVEITAFRRQYSKDKLALAEGRIVLGRLEIARLDNDPDFPERGVLELEMHGGK